MGFEQSQPQTEALSPEVKEGRLRQRKILQLRTQIQKEIMEKYGFGFSDNEIDNEHAMRGWIDNGLAKLFSQVFNEVCDKCNILEVAERDPEEPLRLVKEVFEKRAQLLHS